MKKPKVAIIHPAVGESLGGSQIFVLELSERLRNKCDMTILSGNQVNDLCKPVFSVSRNKSAKIDSSVYKSLKKLLKYAVSTPDIVIEHLSSFLPVFYDLLTNEYDVIYPNNDWGGLLVASAVRKIKGTPVLFTEHCGFMEKGKIATRNLKFKPDKYIVLSSEMRFWVKKYFPDIDVEHIPNGVNLDIFNPDGETARLNLPKPVFLAASRYQPNKRLNLVIDAVQKLNYGSLFMLSLGENIDVLMEKGKKTLGDRFELMTVPYDKIASYYRACDVFTLPSVYEPFGLVYLEAMACNKPVVAPNDLSRIEIIGEAGILCEVTDIDEYAKALDEAVNTKFGDVPLNQACQFTWEQCADRYFEVIKSLFGLKSSDSDTKKFAKDFEKVN